jgi:hypothetical protein
VHNASEAINVSDVKLYKAVIPDGYFFLSVTAKGVILTSIFLCKKQTGSMCKCCYDVKNWIFAGKQKFCVA